MAVPSVVLYDHTGTAVPIPGPVNPPRIVTIPDGVRADRNDRYRSYPSRSLTPAKIVSILDQADGGDPLQWIELAEEMVEKDPKLNSVLHTRYSAVLGLEWYTTPAQLDDASEADQALADEIAKFCFGALKASNYRELVGDMLDAIAKPFAVDWINWGEDQEGKIVPQTFARIPSRHIRWAFDSDTIRVFDPTKTTSNDGGMGQPLEPYTTVRAISNPRRDHPTRAGLLRTLAWYEHFKLTAIKDMMAYSDRYGMPVRVLKVDDPDFDNEERFNRFRASLVSLGTDASAIFTKNVEMEIVKTAEQAGVDVFMGIIDYIDKAIAWTVLGHELSSQSSPGSGQLGITASLQVRQDILESDCEFVSNIVSRDVLVPLVGWNFGWDKLSLVPTIYFDYEPPRDLLSEAQTNQIIAKTFPDMAWSEQAIREKFGVDEPLELAGGEDDSMMPAQAPSPAIGLDPFGSPAPMNVNALSERPRHGRPAPRYSPARQKKVDRLASRGIQLGQKIIDGWDRQIRDAIRQAAKAGVPLIEMRQRILKLYPELDAKQLEQTIAEESIKARLYGRNA